MQRHFIWLDDERPIKTIYQKILHDIPAEKCEVTAWHVVSTGEEAVRLIKRLSQIPDCKIFISFDHDLGYGINGYDVAKWIVANEISIAGFTVHSMNPVGAKNIVDLLTHYGYVKMKFATDIANL